MLPSNTERSRNSGLDAHSMKRHAAAWRRERAFITSDHVQRFGTIAPSGPAGGGAYAILPASGESAGSSKIAT